MIKRYLSCLVCAALVLGLAACGSKVPTQGASAPESDSLPAESLPASSSRLPVEPVSSAPALKLVESIREGDNRVDIPTIAMDNESEAVTGINTAIYALTDQANEYLDSGEEQPWIEIVAYPFTSADHLQVVMVKNIFPTYGTVGQIYSFNYDIANDTALSLDQLLAELGLSADAIAAEFTPEGVLEENQSFVRLAPAAFRITAGGAEIYCLLTFSQDGAEADTIVTYLTGTHAFKGYDYERMTPFFGDTPAW